MRIEVNGTRLWFDVDVDGPVLVTDGPRMLQRPTVILVHGGPGTYDHSYFKSDLAALTFQAQLVYLDLRDHGRSERHVARDWSLELCADDLRAFCDALGIVRPVVLGHSLGGAVAMLYGARHPGHAGALILQSAMARFDLDRIVDGFRRVAGDLVAELARRDYRGDSVADEEWAAVFAAFGPRVPDTEQLARRMGNPELREHGMTVLRGLDVVDQLSAITCPTLVCVGQLDPVTPVAAAEEIFNALPPGTGQLHVIEGAGHFPWLDCAEEYSAVVTRFVAAAGCASTY